MPDRRKLTVTEAPRLEGPGPGGLRDRRTLDRVLMALVVVCALLVAASPLVEQKPYFEQERLLGFYAVVGAGAAALVVLVARLLAPLVRRPEGDHVR